MAGADRNRVQQYLSATREPSESASGLDAGLFIRGLVDPSTPEDAVRADYDQRRAAGKDDNTIGQEYVGLGQRELAKSWTQQRSEAMKRYTDQNERSRAIADAETGVQKVARILGEMANAYAGGKPGEITATLRKYRDAERARADKQAGDQLGFELEGIESERTDARSAATLEAARQDRLTARDDANTRHRETIDAANERHRQTQDGLNTRAGNKPVPVNPYDPNRPRTRGEQDRYDLQQGELQTPYGAAQDKQSADALRKFNAAANSLRGSLTIMKTIRDKYKGGFQGLTSAERASDQAKARQAAADALLATKDMNVLGVLSATDYTILNALLPQDPSAWVFGAGDPIMAKIDGAIEQVDAKEKASAGAYLKRGATPPGGGGERTLSVTTDTGTPEQGAAPAPDAAGDVVRLQAPDGRIFRIPRARAPSYRAAHPELVEVQ